MNQRMISIYLNDHLAGSVMGSRGIEAVYLEVRDSNQRARQLYRSRGFEEVGRRRGYYRRPVEDAIVLRRTFKQAK